MSTPNKDYDRIERLLKRVRPQEPSAELEERVQRAAQQAWRDDAAGIPWRIPILRLALSTAAAAVIVTLANLYGDRASYPRRAPVPAATCVEPCDLDITGGTPVSFARYAATTDAPIGSDASALFDHLRAVRETLRETEENGLPQGPGLRDPRSHLPPHLHKGANA